MPAPAPASPEPVTFVIPALVTWGRSGGRPDPTAPRRAKLVGYYTRGATPNHTRLREYLAWKDHVRAHAPPALRQLRPVDEASRVRLDVVCYFATRTHADPENVRKSLVDALFPQGDKWVYGAHDHPRYDAARPRVEVTVTLFPGTGAAAVQARPTPPAPEGAPVPAKKETPPRPVTPAASAPGGKPAQRPKKTPQAPPENKPSRNRKAETTSRAGKTPRPKSPPAPASPPERKGLWARLEDWAARLTGQTEPDAGRPGPRPPRPGGRNTRRG